MINFECTIDVCVDKVCLSLIYKSRKNYYYFINNDLLLLYYVVYVVKQTKKSNNTLISIKKKEKIMICYDRSRDFLLLIFLLLLYFCWFQREKYYYYLPKTYLSVSCLSLSYTPQLLHTHKIIIIIVFFVLYTVLSQARANPSSYFVFRQVKFSNSNINKTDSIKH